TLCFTPGQIRQRYGMASFVYNNCGQGNLADSLRDTGYAIANLRISDERAGLPGTTFTMPVYSDTSLATYNVYTILYSVRWNKTLLDLKTVRPSTAAGAGATIAATPVVYGERDATVQLTVIGKNIRNPGELAQIDFEVLRGDTL